MSKKRRTRKEKIVAQLKRELTLAQKESHIENYKLKEVQTETATPHVFLTKYPTQRTFTTRDYSYVFHDIKRTLLVTFLILFIQTILLVLSQRNLINLYF